MNKAMHDRLVDLGMDIVRKRLYSEEHPKIVCLCGSTRFWRDFQRASLGETLAGRIVLSIGAASGTDDEHFGNLSREEYDRVKEMLDELHKRKIDLADEVLVLNVGGYIGNSTTSEVEYAIRHKKPLRWLEMDRIPTWVSEYKPLTSPEEWHQAYVQRLVDRGLDRAFAEETFEAGKDDHDWVSDPVDAADDELYCW